MALSHPCTLGLNRTVLKSFLGREEKREGERERSGGSSQLWPGQFWSKSAVEFAE